VNRINVDEEANAVGEGGVCGIRTRSVGKNKESMFVCWNPGPLECYSRTVALGKMDEQGSASAWKALSEFCMASPCSVPYSSESMGGRETLPSLMCRRGSSLLCFVCR
jgi:hypothetical protein